LSEPEAGVSEPGGATTNPDRAARERELLRRYHVEGDTRARDALAEEMVPLARALAGRYSGRGEPLDDLVQVACVGIMKAIEGFDLDRDVRFSSYATPTVLGEIKRHFRDKTWAMRVPRGMQELQIELAKARDKLTTELGRSPTVHALARRAHGRGRHARRLDRRARPGDRPCRDARPARRRLRRPLRARP
jgi:RNA polymerase sigma-B factor